MNYLTFIPYVNEQELLSKALESVRCMWDHTIIIDNGPYSNKPLKNMPVKVYRPSTPLTFAQTQNLMQDLAFQRDLLHFFYLHSDAEVQADGALKMIELAESKGSDRWGAIFTNYDIFAAFNTSAMRAVGRWDWRMFPGYYSDCDYFYRIKLLGYSIIPSDLPVLHHNQGSNSIKNDAYLSHLNQLYMERSHVWYQYKWGGVPGKEIFTKPFNGQLIESL